MLEKVWKPLLGHTRRLFVLSDNAIRTGTNVTTMATKGEKGSDEGRERNNVNAQQNATDFRFRYRFASDRAL